MSPERALSEILDLFTYPHLKGMPGKSPADLGREACEVLAKVFDGPRDDWPMASSPDCSAVTQACEAYSRVWRAYFPCG